MVSEAVIGRRSYSERMDEFTLCRQIGALKRRKDAPYLGGMTHAHRHDRRQSPTKGTVRSAAGADDSLGYVLSAAEATFVPLRGCRTLNQDARFTTGRL